VPLAADNNARLCGKCRREQHGQLRDAPARHSPEFFETDDLRAALQSRDMGRVFTAYRNHPRHLKLFGKALNQETLGRWLGLTQAQVSKIERSSRPETRLDVLIGWANILQLPLDMLWFDLPNQSRFAGNHQSGQAPRRGSDVLDRVVVALGMVDQAAGKDFGLEPRGQASHEDGVQWFNAATLAREQAEDLTSVFQSLTFLGSTSAEEAPSEGNDQICDQLAKFLFGLVGTMNRRELLRLLGWTAMANAAFPGASELDTDEQQRLTRAITSPSRVDEQVIDHIETMHLYCKRQDDALGARTALPIALVQRDLARGLLAECPTALRPRLLAVYSDMSTSIGYYFYDLDDLDSARHYCDQGRAAAHDAGHAELGIYALCEMSDHASWHGKSPAAIDLAAAAQSLANKTDDPLMRVFVAQRAASAYAVDGQYKASMTQCEKAEDSLASAGQVSAGSTGYFLNEGYLARMRSECLLRLDRPQEAAASASAGLTLYDKSFVDGYTQCALNLGNAHLRSGEIDEAARVVGDAGGRAARTRSARLVKELHTTRARMQPWRATHAVRELDDHLATCGLIPNSTSYTASG
jgi:hypothetical protein